MRHDSVRTSDKTHVTKAGLQPEAAKTGIGNNDTSVIRGPATMKAGRLDSYGAFRKTPPGDSHRIIQIRSRGVEDKLREANMKLREIGSPVSPYILSEDNQNELSGQI